MVQGERLIILSFTKVRDNSLVIHTLSKTWGRRSFLVNVGKNVSLALFQPLGIVDAVITENRKSDLWRAGSFSQSYPLLSIRQDMFKNAMVMFMGEVLYRLIKDGAGEEGLFEWCESRILLLEEMKGDYSNFHLRFLLELSVTMGFAPSPEDLAPFASESMNDARRLLQSDFETTMLLPLTGDRRSALCEIFVKYLAHHSGSALEIRSLRILHEILA